MGYITGHNYWATTLATVIVGLLTAVWLIKRNQKIARKCKQALAEKQFPENYSIIPPEPPGNGAPLMTGIRVVDMSTVIAGPCCARMLGDFGAEVIKVEEPKGDYWRNFFLPYEPGRLFSTAFEAVNFSKKSIALDVKKKGDLKKLKDMLKDADVFIVNVRTDSLKKLGLSYEQIQNEFPHLIYAQVTAWGSKGPDYQKPGYDLGAFWAATGMAASIQSPGSFSGYVVGLGDGLVSSLLFAAIQLSLVERLTTGRGRFISSSLFHAGVWCLLPDLVKPISQNQSQISGYKQKPHNPYYTSYRTQDDKFFYILGFGKESEYRKSLEIDEQKYENVESELSALRARFKTMKLSQVLEYLTSRNVSFLPVTQLDEFIKADENTSPWKESKVFCSLMKESIQTVRIPFDIHCSEDHDIKCRAPRIGQSTKSFFQRGWSPIDPQAVIKRAESGDITPVERILEDIDAVILVSQTRICALMVGKMLQERGASVTIFVEPGNLIQTRYPELFKQITLEMKLIQSDLDNSELLDHIKKSNCFISDMQPGRLQQLQLDYESLRSKFPQLVYTLCPLYSALNEKDDLLQGDLGPFWGLSGLGDALAGKPPAFPPPQPSFLGDLMGSIHVLSAVGGGLFHQKRTGEGTFCEASLLRAGVFSLMTSYQIIQFDPFKIALLQVSNAERQRTAPVSTANSFGTKDGVWFQLLGVDLDRHLPKLLSALNVKYSTYLKAVQIVLTKALWSKEKSLVLKLMPVFVYINTLLKEKFEQMTWKECQQLMEEHDVWYCPVNTIPALRYSPQAEALEIFQVDEATGLTSVRTPIEFK